MAKHIDIMTNINNTTILFDDVSHPGTVSAILGQLFAGDTVHAVDSDGQETFIPYSSVGCAYIGESSNEQTRTDDLCEEVGE